MIIKQLFATFACSILIIAGSACSATQNGSGDVVSAPIRATSGEITGSYELIAVNGARIPATVSHGEARIKVHSGTFIIRADETCSSTTEFSPPAGGKITRKVHATYKRNGSNLVMQWEGAGETRGNIEDGTFTMDNHGMIFVYSRSGEIDDSMKLDLANECDAGTDTTGIDKAQADVFDDFNSGLQSGKDRNGNRIGFFTFRDSDSSLVGISTTADHPRLPGEVEGNEVLQLDLEVKAWAGLIHHFENSVVNRWIPRDWRGFSEFSFWLHGNNSNTSLFVEILDNRKPCPAPAGAEVYTYVFSDNFSGWKQITVPFEKLIRKEIYNDAPNDGLGLSEVHGWAFGTLGTGGPTTYYIDDFELR